MKQIKITEGKVTEALAQIDTLDGLSLKNRSCLRLLTEEVFSMVRELLQVNEPDFTLQCMDGKYTLCVATKTRVDENAKEQFLSMSSDGKNAAKKGVKGLLGSVLEVLFIEEDPSFYYSRVPYGMHSMDGGYSYMWSLSDYMQYAPKETISHDWDGMEKSIIANFADDVAIGVRSGKLEMTVTKIF